jgi:para-aminobenzoate synthetase / 4-amino-4-deoxychorismate lyase
MTGQPRVIFESHAATGDTASFAFDGLVEVVEARTPAEVVPALVRVEAAVAAGHHAAGFVSYEAAAGLDPALDTRSPDGFPLLWFGIFRQRLTIAPEAAPAAPPAAPPVLKPSLDNRRHRSAVEAIKRYIAAGDTYQVNFTFPLRFRLEGDPREWHRTFCRSQEAPYGAYIDTGRFRILSASPELFFRAADGCITVRPMKGTAPRGRWWSEDETLRQALRESVKERAENLMIVDMLRNDLGKIAETGSVRVASLFDVASFPTLHQMTSTITARLREDIGIPDLFRALFPCGSVTGAPKRRTMEIITELEESPRGVYTGCIGYISPGAEMVFSVAIRTAVIDGATGEGTLGVGSGITWDSAAAAEYAECLTKARFAVTPPPDFHLIESLLFEEGTGYFLLERHLARLAASAARFGFRFDPDTFRLSLAGIASGLTGCHKVRLLLGRTGEMRVEAAPVDLTEATHPLPVAFAACRVDSADPLLYHKTTRREFYVTELARRPDCADVIFVNERDEVTEGANHNLVVEIDGALVTPPVASGLLPGVFREEMLATGDIRERAVTREELGRAAALWLINSVRKWRQAKLV